MKKPIYVVLSLLTILGVFNYTWGTSSNFQHLPIKFKGKEELRYFPLESTQNIENAVTLTNNNRYACIAKLAKKSCSCVTLLHKDQEVAVGKSFLIGSNEEITLISRSQGYLNTIPEVVYFVFDWSPEKNVDSTESLTCEFRYSVQGIRDFKLASHVAKHSLSDSSKISLIGSYSAIQDTGRKLKVTLDDDLESIYALTVNEMRDDTNPLINFEAILTPKYSLPNVECEGRVFFQMGNTTHIAKVTIYDPLRLEAPEVVTWEKSTDGAFVCRMVVRSPNGDAFNLTHAELEGCQNPSSSQHPKNDSSYYILTLKTDGNSPERECTLSLRATNGYYAKQINLRFE